MENDVELVSRDQIVQESLDLLENLEPGMVLGNSSERFGDLDQEPPHIDPEQLFGIELESQSQLQFLFQPESQSQSRFGSQPELQSQPEPQSQSQSQSQSQFQPEAQSQSQFQSEPQFTSDFPEPNVWNF